MDRSLAALQMRGGHSPRDGWPHFDNAAARAVASALLLVVLLTACDRAYYAIRNEHTHGVLAHVTYSDGLRREICLDRSGMVTTFDAALHVEEIQVYYRGELLYVVGAADLARLRGNIPEDEVVWVLKEDGPHAARWGQLDDTEMEAARPADCTRPSALQAESVPRAIDAPTR